MWDNIIEEAFGVVWETLCAQSGAVPASYIQKQTGVPLPHIYAGLNKMSEIGLLEVSDRKSDQWQAKRKIDAMTWAHAVEIGIPLRSLEKTIGLSVKDRRTAERAAASGEVDRARDQRQAQKKKNRDMIIRGRAASRAATTDLAKIVQDAAAAFEKTKNPANLLASEELSGLKKKPIKNSEKTQPSEGSVGIVQKTILDEAQKALELMIKALERG